MTYVRPRKVLPEKSSNRVQMWPRLLEMQKDCAKMGYENKVSVAVFGL
jgi:hypothetical protein